MLKSDEVIEFLHLEKPQRLHQIRASSSHRRHVMNIQLSNFRHIEKHIVDTNITPNIDVSVMLFKVKEYNDKLKLNEQKTRWRPIFCAL